MCFKSENLFVDIGSWTPRQHDGIMQWCSVDNTASLCNNCSSHSILLSAVGGGGGVSEKWLSFRANPCGLPSFS